MEQTNSMSISLRWKEIYSLAALSAAVSISWIAYHEYQPHLLDKFGLNELSLFLIVTKGIVLVIIPPIAGWIADVILKKTSQSINFNSNQSDPNEMKALSPTL